MATNRDESSKRPRGWVGLFGFFTRSRATGAPVHRHPIREAPEEDGPKAADSIPVAPTRRRKGRRHSDRSKRSSTQVVAGVARNLLALSDRQTDSKEAHLNGSARPIW